MTNGDFTKMNKLVILSAVSRKVTPPQVLEWNRRKCSLKNDRQVPLHELADKDVFFDDRALVDRVRQTTLQ